MKVHWIALGVVVAINLLLDFLIYRWLSRHGYKKLSTIHATVSVALQGLLAFGMSQPFGDASVGDGRLTLVMWLMWIYFTVYVPKTVGLILAIPTLLPLPRGMKRGISRVAAAVGVLLFAVMWYGTVVTPYKTEIHEVTLTSPTLPPAFNGYRIAHISDLHLGTYGTDTTFVSRVVKQINDLRPDVVCFTGDLVSRRTSEAQPFKTVLSRLRASDGVIAILGNHDYDDYARWPTEEEKRRDHEALCNLQREAGWKLLLNQPHIVVHNTDTLLFIGAENYGEGAFTNYCDMSHAYPDSVQHLPYKILLQHNPVQWREQILPETDIDLTLSGHTHAMQIILSFFGRRWSPASWRYSEWGGLYSNGNQHLYVNTGLGMVGVPMRIGATPEITIITLKKAS